jgi:hypothetical protein
MVFKFLEIGAEKHFAVCTSSQLNQELRVDSLRD